MEDYIEYEINKDTLAIVPQSQEKCKALELDMEYDVSSPAFSVIEHSCEYFGSTYLGRYVGTKTVAGITHKSPILIEDTNKIIFFPTMSPVNPECVWLALNNIKTCCEGRKKGTSKVIFKNGTVIDLNVSINSLSNQVLRASRLRYLLEERQFKN